MNSPVFKSPEKQAIQIVHPFIRLGEARHDREDNKLIFSVRTRAHRINSLKHAAVWLRENRIMTGLKNMTQQQAILFLAERSELVQQKQLNNDRVALNLLFDEPLPKVKSELEQILTTRAYWLEQIPEITARQKEHNRLATEIALAGGLRAHELFTILPRELQAPSDHRIWREDRFLGRKGVKYVVTGKGGLIREVVLPYELSEVLESRALAYPRTVVDRGVVYDQHYDINGGQKWSQSFSAASMTALGWSNGAHGLRHNYAQSRIIEIQQLGVDYKTVQRIVSQEMGHFRPEITSLYYR